MERKGEDKVTNQTQQAMFSSNRDDWETPQEFFDKLNERYHFTLDPCSSDANAKCQKHYTKQDNGRPQPAPFPIMVCIWRNE